MNITDLFGSAGDAINPATDALGGYANAAAEATDPFSQGLAWASANYGDLFSDKPAPVDAEIAGADKVGSDWASGVEGATGPGAAAATSAAIGSKAWFDNSMSDLAKWAMTDKGQVAIGTGLAAAAKYASDRQRDKILQEHYRQQDELAASKQANAQTSGENLNVAGLIASQQYKPPPGGFVERRARNLGAKP